MLGASTEVSHHGAVSDVLIFESNRYYVLADIVEAEQRFEWLDVESGALDGFFTRDGEVLEPTVGADGVYIHLARSGTFDLGRLAQRLASASPWPAI
jgi:hypothetical protein